MSTHGSSEIHIKKIEAVLNSCQSVRPVPLASYVEDYFSKSLEELACMPGTPSQVMAAQFVLHARLAEDLEEVYNANTDLFCKIVDALLRSPNARARRR